MYLIYKINNTLYFSPDSTLKQSGTFANRKYEELSYPKNQKMCNFILVTLLKKQPHVWKWIQSWKYDPIQRHISISLLQGRILPPGKQLQRLDPIK